MKKKLSLDDFDEMAFSPSCDVYLCSKTIPRGGFWLASVAWLCGTACSSASSRHILCADEKYRHWMVAFARRGDDVTVFQASRDASGQLSAFMTYSSRAKFLQDESEKRHLGSYEIPHERTQNLLTEMSDVGGQYYDGTNDCRSWAMEVLRRLGILIPSHHIDEAEGSLR
ncbi:hypothetical protein V5799_010269 [Amblyomma americanum]|uniref:Uncharacterized protein n=1 Tax=Amblyomma americanum TaxID=6943 RepID=A0AAQ4F849_AMBAM